MLNRLSLVLVAALGVMGCNGNTQPICDICTSGAIVYGRVATPTGGPIAGARVDVDLHNASCATPSVGSGGPVTISDAAGSYRVFARSILGPAMACMIVTATPPAGSGAGVSADTGRSVQLRSDIGASPIFDSVRVDIVARPLP